MKIYVAHSNKLNFEEEFYKPLRSSELNDKHEIVLPHENSDKTFNSKDYLKETDIMIAEVSLPSTGMGIELGWADANGVKIVCIYKKDSEISNSLKVVCNEFIEYDSPSDLVSKLSEII